MEFTNYGLYDLINRSGPLWLMQADLSNATMVWVTLSRANLSEADLMDANLFEVDLAGVKYTRTTKWHRLFIPAKAGAILVP